MVVLEGGRVYLRLISHSVLSVCPASEPTMKKIAIFIGQSLLSQGALSYFKKHSENDVEVCSLDVFNPREALKNLRSFKPDIVIVESQYLLKDPSFSQSSILELFPDLIILELRVDSPEVQVIRSERRQPSSFDDLASTLGINRTQRPAIPAQQVYAHA